MIFSFGDESLLLSLDPEAFVKSRFESLIFVGDFHLGLRAVIGLDDPLTVFEGFLSILAF